MSDMKNKHDITANLSKGRAFVAGVIPFKIAQQMAKSATSVLWRTYREVPISIQAVQVGLITSCRSISVS